MSIRDRVVELRRVPASQLRANPANWRTHPPAQQRAMRSALEEIGFAGAALAYEGPDGDLVLIDGHLRQEISEDAEVPVIVLDVDEQEALTLLATFDPIAAMATVDGEALQALMQEVTVSNAELAALLDSYAPAQREGLTDPDEVPEPPADPITRPGDLWLLGPHRLLCGDATDVHAIGRVMGEAEASMLWTDPPYGVAYRDTGDGAWGPEKLARKKAGTLVPRFDAIEADDLRGEALTEFWARFLMACQAVLGSRAAVYCCFASLRSPEVFAAYDRAGYEPRAELIWLKSRPGFNFAHYKHQHEPILYGAPKAGSVDWYGDRTQVSVLNVASESGKDYLHPTQKPVELIAKCMLNSSRPGEWVLDPFAGSGSTVIAGEMHSRRVAAVEIDPAYCDVIVQRWQSFTAQEATRG